ncbi:MAG TPA: hypothetical protein VGH02_02185 [Rhizomicrobium sp.]|jgi:hypothetical protein
MLCNAIFGVFCLALPMGNTTADMQYLGFGGVVSVSAQGWNATLSLGTDAPQVLNPKDIAEYCDDGQCVHYWHHCTTMQAGKMACDFSFDERCTSVTASFAADSQEGADRALASIGFVPDYNKPRDAIALSAFSQMSVLAQPPVCNFDSNKKPDAGCPATQPLP